MSPATATTSTSAPTTAATSTTSTPASTAPASDPQPTAAKAPPTREQQCAAAVRKVVGTAALVPVARDARDFTPTAAERKAIGRAVKAMNVLMYEGVEQRKVAAAFDHWIANGASFEVLQAVKLLDRRLVIVTFQLDTAPSLDVGPYMEVVATEPRSTSWREITGASYDPDARIVATASGDLVFEKLRVPGELEVWLVSLKKPTGKRPELESIKAFASCGAD
jgi:hypothetical protein